MPGPRLSLSLLLALAVALSAASAGSADSRRPAEPEPVPSLAPARDGCALGPPRRPACAARAGDGCLPPAACRLLRRDRLAAPGDEARCERLALRRLLRLDPAGRRRQDAAARRPGLAHPGPRPAVPCPRGDPLRDLESLGREYREQLAHGRGDGARADGGRRVRRRQGRHLGAQRGRLGRPQGRRRGAREPPRVPARPVRGRGRRSARAGRGLRHRARPADGRPLHVPGHGPELAHGRVVLGRGRDVRDRLVPGGVRGRPQLGRSRRGDRGPPRVPDRLPPARARARGRRPGGDRGRALVPARRVQPPRERSLAAGLGLRLDDGAGGADGGVRVRPGRRSPLPHRDDGTGPRPLGLRLGPAERLGDARRGLRRPDELRARPLGRGRARLGRACRPRGSGRRCLRAARAERCGASGTSPTRARARRGGRSGRGASRCSSSRRPRRPWRRGRLPPRSASGS